MNKIAVQLYTLRNLKLPFDQLLGEVAAIGYSGVELVGDHGLSADAMKALLDKHQLKAVSAHVMLQAIESDLNKVVNFHKEIGNHDIIVPWIGEDLRGTDAETWSKFGHKLNTIGQKLADVGMRFHYHNHDFEMRVADGLTGMEWMLDAAQPANLNWEADVAWIQRGGQDIAALLTKYSGRIKRLHAKDNAPVGQHVDQGGFADVGHGTIEWNSVLSAAKACGVEWYVVEHDLPKDALSTIKRGFEYLKKHVV